jgi:hypothetical protein
VFAEGETPGCGKSGRHVGGDLRDEVMSEISKGMKWGEKEMRELNRRLILGVFVLTLALVGSVGPVLALNVDIPDGADESTTLGFTVYDIIVTKMLKGPIGVAGVAFIALGAIQAVRNNLIGAVPAVLAGRILIKADSVVRALGAII